MGSGESWPASPGEVAEAFEAEYRLIYGMAIPDVGVEVVTWRLSAYADKPSVEPDLRMAGGSAAPSPRSTRDVVFDRGADPVPTPVYSRDRLGAGARLAGPAVVEERETTTVIRPGWTAEVAPDGSIVATRDAARPRGDRALSATRDAAHSGGDRT